jgi:hypothetical protein
MVEVCSEAKHSLCKRFLSSKESAGEAYLAALENNANDFIRTTVVVPYCKKYGYTFSSGMGSWSFSLNGNTVWLDECRYSDSKPTEFPEEWEQENDGTWFHRATSEDKNVMDILNFKYSWDRICIGSYMKDITLDDLRRP